MGAIEYTPALRGYIQLRPSISFGVPLGHIHMQKTSKPPINRALVPIILIQLIGAMGYGIMFPLLPYYSKEFGATPFINGVLIATYAVFSFIAGPILGQLSDRHGRRPWLLFSLIGTVIGFVFLGIGGSLWMLFLGRAIDGISGGNMVIAQSYISDVSKPEERTQNFGLMGAAFGVGFVLGPILGSQLSVFGLSVPMWFAAGISAIAAVVTWFMLPESLTPEKRGAAPQRSVAGQFLAIGEVFMRPTLRPLLLMFGAFVMTAFLFISSLGQFMQLQIGVGPDQAGYPAAVFGVFNIVFQMLLLRPMTRRIGERAMIAVGLGALIIPSLGMFFTSSMWVMIGLSIFFALGMTFIRPTTSALLSMLSDPRETGKVLGVSNSLDSLGQIISPLVGGALIERFTPGTPGLLAAAFAMLGLLIYLWARTRLPARAQFGGAKPAAAPQASPAR
jgi:MFS transporter, DHA1 family, tetracycline resistance protein